MTICTRPKQVQTRQNLSTEKAKRKQSLIPNQEAVFSLLFSTGKGKVSFLQWSGAGHIKLTPEQVPSPGVANQQSIASMVLRLYLLFGLVFFFCLTDFYLFVLIFFCIWFLFWLGFFFLLYFKRQRKITWCLGVGRWLGISEELKGERIWSKHIEWK